MRDSGVAGERPFRPRYVTAIDLAAPTADLDGLDGYESIRALVRIAGTPIGIVEQPVVQGKCAGVSLRRAALDQLQWPIVRHLLIDGLAHGFPEEGINPAPFRAIAAAGAPPSPASPSITVVVCTRDRADRLARCLDALIALDPAPDEILIVDNAPDTSAAADLVAKYPRVRYVLEPRPGLDVARTRGAQAACCDVVAYADDDVVVERGWVGALRRAFADPDVSAVAGLVLPLELNTHAQFLFEQYGGFGRGFLRRWWQRHTGEPAPVHAGAGKFGTGANMAFRRAVLEELGEFDPALDVGTATNGGGDLDMFYRVVKSGRLLLYDPHAIVWHQHRRGYDELRDQLTNHGVGFYAYLTRAAMRDPRDAVRLAVFGLHWMLYWNVRRLLQTWFKPGMFPRDLVLAELRGSLCGPFRLARSLRMARLRAPGRPALRDRQNGSASCLSEGDRRPRRPRRRRVVRRVVDVRQPVGAIDDIGDADAVEIEVMRGADRIGAIAVHAADGRLNAGQVRQIIVEEFGTDVLGCTGISERDRKRALADLLRAVFPGSARPAHRPLGADATVSVVVATRDRPSDLAHALSSIAAQHATRPIEVIVVDNNPVSGLTPPAVAAFPGVILVSEPRGGLSYARNRGILSSTGSIVIATDDDVVVPPDWIETLIAPFTDPRVMAVTGDVAADGIETRSARLFEAYGGLGRGAEPLRVDGTWFREFRRAVPTWRLGGTANAAFRAAIFRDPAIGLLDESLGAGTPAGCSEDTDLFYRILRAGHRIVYEPAAVVRHRHRATMPALRRQLYAYAKGHVAYHLTTLTRDGDLRAIVRLALEMPELYWWRVRTRLTGESEYPLSLVAVEIAGFLAGPWAWWRSRLRARRLGPSAAGEGDGVRCSTT